MKLRNPETLPGLNFEVFCDTYMVHLGHSCLPTNMHCICAGQSTAKVDILSSIPAIW